MGGRGRACDNEMALIVYGLMGCVCMHVSAFDLDFSWFLVEA